MGLYVLELYPGGGQSSGDVPKLSPTAAQALDEARQALDAMAEVSTAAVRVTLVLSVLD